MKGSRVDDLTYRYKLVKIVNILLILKQFEQKYQNIGLCKLHITR